MPPYTLTPPYLLPKNLGSCAANASSLVEAPRDFVRTATNQLRSSKQRVALSMLLTSTGIRSVSIAKAVQRI